MKISVYGLGYIGLPTSAALASTGATVLGIDVNPRYVSEINAGRVPIVEPDLDTLVEKVVADGTLRASTEGEPADAFLIAVPTPFKDNFTPDLKYVEAATRSIAPHLAPGNVVVLESTSPAGTTEFISGVLAECRPDLTFPHMSDDPQIHLAHCPERVLPGRIMIELFENDRAVGGMTPTCSEKAAAIYRRFCRGEIVLTDSRSAEMAKLTENAFRDVNIAFANELAEICRELSIDVWEVIRLANRHPRVNVLSPGPGVGGHCIAVDPWFIVSAAPGQARLIRTAREINDSRPSSVLADIQEAIDGIESPVVTCLGLSFKANIDDLRESPAVEVTRLAATHLQAEVRAVEPHVSDLPDQLKDTGVVLHGTTDGLDGADVVVLLVDHDQFRSLADHPALQTATVIDTRGMWRAQSASATR